MIALKEALKKKEYFSIFIRGRRYKGFFSNAMIDRSTIPEGWYMYDLREIEDDEKMIGEIKDGRIFNNFFGTFCTQEKLPIEKEKSLSSNEFDYSFY